VSAADIRTIADVAQSVVDADPVPAAMGAATR
jgi:hypothetical protein